MHYLAGILGALLIVAGVAVIYWPAALIVAGALLLVLDSRIPAPATTTETEEG